MFDDNNKPQPENGYDDYGQGNIVPVLAGRACPVLNPVENKFSREFHIPHAHRVESIPSVLKNIEQHLNNHRGTHNCLVLLESLTPSHAMLSKETTGEVLTALARGDRERAADLLQPFAESEPCSNFLAGREGAREGLSEGAQFLDYCIESGEYAFVLADSLSELKTNIDFTVSLTDLDSVAEQRLVHRFLHQSNMALREFDSMIRQDAGDEETPQQILDSLQAASNRHVAALACMVSPLRNGAMLDDTRRASQDLETLQEPEGLLVVLYGLGHIEIALQRNEETFPEGVRFAESGAMDKGFFSLNPTLSMASVVAAGVADDFESLNEDARIESAVSHISHSDSLRHCAYLAARLGEFSDLEIAELCENPELMHQEAVATILLRGLERAFASKSTWVEGLAVELRSGLAQGATVDLSEFSFPEA